MAGSELETATVRRRVSVLLAAVFWAGLGAASNARAPTHHVTPPPPGDSAPTVLALLRYNLDLCDGVAGKIIGRWRRLGESPQAEESVRDYLVNEQLSELAAGRATTDIIRTLLPATRSEAGAETASSLERMADLVQRLCDTVAWPTAPREDFAAKIRRILDDVEREQEELGGLLVVPREKLRAALAPYLSTVQLAGVEAQNEYLDYLESIKPVPQGPTLQQLMQAWHQRYAEAATPTKQALGKYLQARSRNDGKAMAAACKEILEAVIPLLRDDVIFKLPTPLVPASRGMTTTVLPPLQQAYREIRNVAVHCKAGRSREVTEHLGEMQSQLQSAAAHLAQYSLTP